MNKTAKINIYAQVCPKLGWGKGVAGAVLREGGSALFRHEMNGWVYRKGGGSERRGEG